MGNNPVSMVDPDGGYINQSSAGQAARAQFLHQQAWDRTLQRNRYSYEFLYNNYQNAVEDLYRDHFYSINKDFNDYAFLEDLYRLNNDYMGLGLGNMYMSSGMDYVSQNTLYSDYGRSLMSDLTGQNGTAATMAGIAASIPGPDQWTLASPADRLKIGLENGIYKSYTLVGAYRKKQQVGERDNAENGETDDFITGYEFHYETDDGKEFKSYINEVTQDSKISIWNVYNASNYTVYFKPEKTTIVNGITYSNENSYPLEPGQGWNHGVDGIGIPGGRPNEVYKIKTYMDYTFGVTIFNNSVMLGLQFGPVPNGVNELFGGGWKGQDWLNSLHSQTNSKGDPAPDNTWDSLFNRVR